LPPRVLILQDDQPPFRLLAWGFQQERIPCEVVPASKFRDALQVPASLAPQVVILNVASAGAREQAIAHLHEQLPAAMSIALVTEQDPTSGARHTLTPPFELAQIIALIDGT